MKTRCGFVSNSSSSSFVVVCPKDQFDRYVEKAHPFYRMWAKSFRLPTQKFLGKECVVISGMFSSEDPSGMESYGCKNLPKDVSNYGDKEKPTFDSREIMSNFVDELKKNCEDLIAREE